MQTPLRRLLRYAAPHRAVIVRASTFSVLNKLFDLAPPILIGIAIDVVVKREDSFLASRGIESVDHQLLALAIMTFVIWGLESLFEYLYAITWRSLAQTIQHSMRLDAFGRLTDLELRWFEDRSTGGVMSVLSDDVNQLERFLDGGANNLIQVVTTVVLVSLLFFGVSPSVAIFAMVPMPFVIWGSLKYQRKLAPRYAAVRSSVADLNARLAGDIGGIATIKSFVAERWEHGRVAELSTAYEATNTRAIRLSAGFSPLIRIVILVGFTSTLIWGGWLVTRDRLDPAAYAVLVFMTQRLLWPLTSLGTTLDLYQRAMASVVRILSLIETEPRITDGPVDLASRDVRGAVELDAVTFAYVPGQPVLQDLSILVPAGTTAAIVGSTGGGKTTVLKLLLRLHEHDSDGSPRDGTITIDGHEIQTLTLASLRRSIALVSQDVFLFDGSVRDNIAYGRIGDEGIAALDMVAQRDVEEAARLAEAHSFITELPDGYDTQIGERGVRLSGGQRQRIAMARAILKDAPILVLDEATSNVDNETEAAMQRSLSVVSRDRTTLIIAHRLSTIRHADMIHVLDRGRVVESGDHDTLVAQNGSYAVLWRVQTGESN